MKNLKVQSSKLKWKCIMLALIIMLAALAGPVMAGEKQLEFRWEQNISADFAGWKLYMSQTAGDYTGITPIDIPFVSQQTTYSSQQMIISPDGQEVVYFFVLTAYDTDGNESGPSNEVNATIDFEGPESPFTLTVTIVSGG